MKTIYQVRDVKHSMDNAIGTNGLLKDGRFGRGYTFDCFRCFQTKEEAIEAKNNLSEKIKKESNKIIVDSYVFF